MGNQNVRMDQIQLYCTLLHGGTTLETVALSQGLTWFEWRLLTSSPHAPVHDNVNQSAGSYCDLELSKLGSIPDRHMYR